jgi:hypothetical protein
MGSKFTKAVLTELRGGKLLYRDAARLLRLKVPTLKKFSEQPRDVAGGISVHRLNVPVCDDCWKNLSETAQTHYWNKPAELQRCSFCGCGTANGLFVRFDKAKFPSL